MAKHRVQIDFSEKAFRDLTKLKDSAEQVTIAGTIRGALAVYRWWLETERGGGEILVRTKSGQFEKMSFFR